jgi:putative chitinase
MTRYLSNHFSLDELTATQHREVDNTPSAQIVAVLTDTAEHMEAVRELLNGQPIHVNSGYRSPLLNRIVGGAASSAHMSGHAVDFICPGFGDPLAICHRLAASHLAFDQVIQEGTWVHISFDPKGRREVLTRAGSGYVPGLAA